MEHRSKIIKDFLSLKSFATEEQAVYWTAKFNDLSEEQVRDFLELNEEDKGWDI